jgi:hypothetical protein
LTLAHSATSSARLAKTLGVFVSVAVGAAMIGDLSSTTPNLIIRAIGKALLHGREVKNIANMKVTTAPITVHIKRSAAVLNASSDTLLEEVSVGANLANPIMHRLTMTGKNCNEHHIVDILM